MQNTLYKESKRTYVPGSPSSPGYPGQPYQPARTVFEERTTCTYSADTIAVIGDSAQSGGTSKTAGRATSYSYKCTTRSVPVTYPEQEYIPPRPATRATPSRTIIDYQVGWTGRARSIASVYGSATCKFRVPSQTTGAVVGLTTEYYPSGYRDIRWAWYVSGGIARVIEQGEVLHTFGPVNISTELRVDVLGKGVFYYVNDVLVHQTDTGESAVMHMGAALYTAGDYVDSPEIEGAEAASAGGELLPVIGYATEVADVAIGYGAFLPVIGAGGVAIAADGISPISSSGDGMMLSVIGLGSEGTYASGYGMLMPVTGYGSADELAPEYAIGDGEVFPVIGYGAGYVVEGGSSDGELLPVIGLGSVGAYTSGAGVLLPVVAFGKEGIPGELEVAFAGISEQRAVLSGEMLIVFSSSGEAATLLQFGGGVLHATLLADALADTAMGLSGAVGAKLHQLAVVTDTVPFFAAFATWALNLENNGSTRYEGFDFNSFAMVGDAYYGCKPDGVYVLDGEDDAGDAIQAMVSFGKQDFGTSALKRISNAYVGVSSTGKLVLRVIAEGATYDYVARDADEQLQTQRFDTGRGLRVNQLGFELYNQNGDDFELSTIEFAVLPTARRV